MLNKCASFDEVCRRAAGRRAYNKRRRLERERRISTLLALTAREPETTARELAARLGVHESTISRDLRFVRKVRAEYRRGAWGAELWPSSFRWLRGGGYETVFEIRHGLRVK